ncbi:molybdopterin-guanine dinucleotide biosynthesis protein MobB [Salidesulfovibrio brasiliensis]|uniref:molybdopterin-guanine dinucleotide biosynthesis protein MobB n=1 Tax=Salidesulfovibrio brasiliensis TaxID=221711 RepID=UPI0006D00364|nr:molybdopterin-guanine dinucleotide biosynthesis protein MobB [Salidesulfovibrio brasiliensis]
MNAVSIVGPKKAGKTTLGLALCSELRQRGIQVAAAKHSSHGFDRQDTDTARYAEICSGVLGFGPNESFAVWPKVRPLIDLLPLMDAEFMVVEGGKYLGWMPRVLVLDEEPAEGIDWLSPELAVAVFGRFEIPGIPSTRDPKELADIVLERGFVLPALDCEACGRPDCRSLATEIVAGEATVQDCASLTAAAEITINGTPLGTNPFVEKMIAATVRGMLSTLKGFAPGKAEIKVDV